MQEIMLFKETAPVFFYLLIAAIGLSIGSFLNVLIFRLPLIMNNDWADDAEYYLKSKKIEHSEIKKTDTRFTTLGGRSFCTSCNSQIPGWLNIPVLGWIILRGKAKCCGAPFSFRYPAIEFIAGAVTVFLFYRFQIPEAAALSLASYMLLSLAMIDRDTMLLPDIIVIPFMWVGLLVNAEGLIIPIESAVYGVAIGYFVMTVIPFLYGKITGRSGIMMGQGDVKLIAASGAWLGATMLPFVFIIGSISTIMMMLALKDKFSKKDELISDKPIMPFGPGLAAGIFLCLIFKENILDLFNIIS